MTKPAIVSADCAALAVKDLADKIDLAEALDARITNLQQMADDYSQQLDGFDSGLSKQISTFEEQIASMRTDLKAGLAQLEQVNNNAETAAVLELTERYEGLASELDATLHSHQELTTFQRQLINELKSLVEAVESMQEQKADRDEVLDGLRDKADSLRLQGLLTEEEFQLQREKLEMRIQMCYDKFRRQDAVWMQVVDDFSELIHTKAEMSALEGVRDTAQEQLQDLHWKAESIAKMLGDPKAAILIRKLAKDALCAVCRVPALMEPLEPIHPMELPAARPLPPPPPTPPDSQDGKICYREFDMKDVIGPEVARVEPHMCNRWTGGSHTLIGHTPGLGTVTREMAPSARSSRPVRKYLGQGVDGKYYNLEEDMVACPECNPMTPEPSAERVPGEADVMPQGDGGGDQGASRVQIVDPNTAARSVMIIDDASLQQAVETPGLKGDQRSYVGMRRSSGAGDKEDQHFPTLAARQSRMDHGHAAVESAAAAHDIEVGQTISGRAALDARGAQQAAASQIVASRASKGQINVPEEVKEEASVAGTEARGEEESRPESRRTSRLKKISIDQPNESRVPKEQLPLTEGPPTE
ncbi:hypothetical protein O0L34_g17534 [Tuta absoluta]|nr:hypothetical protein O0L34_g17534 [Tuta absoluta]